MYYYQLKSKYFDQWFRLNEVDRSVISPLGYALYALCYGLIWVMLGLNEVVKPLSEGVCNISISLTSKVIKTKIDL